MPVPRAPQRLVGAEHEAAEAAADVDEALAGRQPDLAAHMVDLVALRLLQRVRAFAPVGAGVHQQRVVEPQLVELGAQAVVGARIGLGLRGAAVGMAQFVQVVLDLVDRVEARVDVGHQAGGEGGAEVAVDVDLLVEIRLQQADVATRHRRQQGRVAVEHQREGRRALAAAVQAAVGQGQREGRGRARAQRVDQLLHEGPQQPALEFRRAGHRQPGG